MFALLVLALIISVAFFWALEFIAFPKEIKHLLIFVYGVFLMVFIDKIHS